jgi:hypothetical protein
MSIDTDFLGSIFLISMKLCKISFWNSTKHKQFFLSLIIQSDIGFGTEFSLYDIAVALIC